MVLSYGCSISMIRDTISLIFTLNYQGDVAVIEIETAEILAGYIPSKKLRLVQAWIEIHRDELVADWKLATEGKNTFKIKPLK